MALPFALSKPLLSGSIAVGEPYPGNQKFVTYRPSKSRLTILHEYSLYVTLYKCGHFCYVSWGKKKCCACERLPDSIEPCALCLRSYGHPRS